MSLLLFILTVSLIVLSVASAIIFLWLNNFSTIIDIHLRNKSMLGMMRITMIASMVTALLTGLLSDSAAVEAAIQSTVTLYFAIAISMLVLIILCCIVLIYRSVARESYSDRTSSGVSGIIKTATIGAAISLVLAWFLS